MPARSRRRSAATTVAVLLAALAVLTLTGRSAAPLGGTSAPAAAGARTVAAPAAYAYSSVLDGKPVRWNPCAPIRWTANLHGAPAGALDVVKAAVARVAAVSGTRWVYVGTSRTVPSSAALPRQAGASYPPVLIGWTDGTRSDLLRGQRREVLGMTQTRWFGVQLPSGEKVAALRGAVIALDRTDRLPLRGSTSWQTVVLHELGHSMGLAHVGDRRQLMATVLPTGVTDLQAGDRTGLTRVGRAACCVVVPGA